MWQWNPAAPYFFLAAGIAYALSFYIWRLNLPRVKAWAIGTFASGCWAAGVGLDISSVTAEQKLIFVRVVYLSVTNTIFWWSIFAITYSNNEHWLTKKTITALAIIPTLTALLVLTVPYHTLFYETYELVREADNLTYLTKKYGPFFWLWVVYVYLALVAGSALLVRAVVRFPRLYQGQVFSLVLGVAIPLVFNVLYHLGFRPLGKTDIAPITTIVSYLVMAWGILRFRLWSAVPVAYDLVFRSVQSGVLIVDEMGRVLEINPSAEHILDCQKSEVMGKHLLAAFPHYVSLVEQFWKVREDKTEVNLNGRNFETQIMPLHDRSGNPAGRIILLYDITERKKTLEEREELITELDAYAHTVAHDLKNPLTALIGYVELLEELEAEQNSEEIREPLARIGQNSRKMVSIIDELLILASVRNKNEIERQPLAMKVIVQEALERLDDVVDPAEVTLIIPEQWPVAMGYAPWIEEIWVNYMSNAVKYGGRPAVVELGADEQTRPGFIRFWVQDNGVGLTAAEREQLFRAFARLDQHQKVQGHGLGLSIVQRIAEKLGGEVGVTSEAGRGSLFYFTLPAVQVKEPAL